MRYGRHINVLILLAGLAAVRLTAQSEPLVVERDGSNLRFSAPRLHLLEGKPLEQLHNGASVTYLFELTLAPQLESAPVARLSGRFIFSFDLWEEKFTVVQADPPGRSAAQITGQAAVAWCVDSMLLSTQSLSPEQTFVIKLDCSTITEESGGGGPNNSALTLAGLVDVFSRKSRNPQPHWLAVAGPLKGGG